MPAHRRLGTDAEDQVARYLAERGFTIIRRRAKTPSGEIDIVALEGETLVFVEVKMRAGEGAEEALDELKSARLLAAAEEYAHEVGATEREARFDLVTVTPAGIRHYRDVIRG